MYCKICSTGSQSFARARLLDTYNVQYYRCPSCGFVQTEQPYWLDQAYAKPISASDTGLVSRNIALAGQANAIVRLFFDCNGRYLDFGGGYGLFVRLMRDLGLDFFWHDAHCSNLFAQGFESSLSGDFELVTAFEVVEHLPNPIEEVEQILRAGRALLFSTIVLPEPTPLPGQWWYYGLEHGQHVSLFSMRSLELLAERVGKQLNTDGNSLHMLSDKRVSNLLYRAASRRRLAPFFGFALRHLRPRDMNHVRELPDKPLL